METKRHYRVAFLRVVLKQFKGSIAFLCVVLKQFNVGGILTIYAKGVLRLAMCVIVNYSSLVASILYTANSN